MHACMYVLFIYCQVNPFERHILENLDRPFWSPGIFSSTNAATPPQRAWSIDQIAALFPHPIEESPSSHQNPYPVDAATEAKAQEDINRCVFHLNTERLYFDRMTRVMQLLFH